MSGIEKELIGFLTAVISGIVVRLCYQCITCLRNILKHSRLFIELEDIVFWIGVSIYLFVQIYHTSSGSIRWHFVLGVVFGALISTIFLRKMKKVLKKIYNFQTGKNIAKKRKKRYDNKY